MKRDYKVFLATKTGTIDGAVLRIIKMAHGPNTRIKMVTSQRVFNTTKGFGTLVQQNKNTGHVYGIRHELTEKSLETATKTGTPFSILQINPETGKWETTKTGSARTTATQTRELAGTTA